MSYGYPSSDTSSSISMTPATSSPPSAGLSSSTMSLSLPRILAAHAVCGAVATLILLPLGVLIPRYGRAFSKGRWWFPLHMVAQLIGVILAIAAMGTGYTMGGVDGTAHPGLSIALITGLGLQVVLGSFAHWYKGRSIGLTAASGRGVFHFVHIGLGLVVVILGWATALTGFLQHWVGGYGAGLGHFLVGWKILFGVFIGIFGIAYVLAVVAFPLVVQPSRRKTGEDHFAELQERRVHHPAGVTQ